MQGEGANGRGESRLGLAVVLIALFALVGGRLLGDTMAPGRPLLGAASGALLGTVVAMVCVLAVHRLRRPPLEG